MNRFSNHTLSNLEEVISQGLDKDGLCAAELQRRRAHWQKTFDAQEARNSQTASQDQPG
jgi:hypothetical protein